MMGETHISSLVVQARPERLDDVSQAIFARGGEIPATDPDGKLIVVLETDSEVKITDFLNEVAVMKGVISANLVFHQIDEPVTESATASPAPSLGEET